MKSRTLWLAAVALLVVAAATLLQPRADSRDAGPETSDSASAHQRRIRDFWAVYRQATEYRVAGNAGSAVEAYTRALASDPQHEDALYYLGNMLLELGRYRDAAAAWEQLASVNPRSSRAHARLGDLHFCLEPGAPANLERAEAEYRRALRINQEETGPLLRLGEIALVRGNLADAGYFLDAVIGANPGSVEAQVLKGYLAWRAGDRSLAAAQFARAVDLARPAEPPAAVPGEGDTKRGLRPMVVHEMKCGTFPPDLAQRLQAAGSDLSVAMRGVYQGLDRVVEQFRRVRPGTD